jgi:hypothetical protein
MGRTSRTAPFPVSIRPPWSSTIALTTGNTRLERIRARAGSEAVGTISVIVASGVAEMVMESRPRPAIASTASTRRVMIAWPSSAGRQRIAGTGR